MSLHVIVSGSPLSGLSLTGPFPSADDALKHADRHMRGEWWLTTLDTPPGVPIHPRILVEVKGGVAEFTGSTHDVDVEIFDWDNWADADAAAREDMMLDRAWAELNPALPVK